MSGSGEIACVQDNEVMDVVVDLRVGSPCYGQFALLIFRGQPQELFCQHAIKVFLRFHNL